MNKNFQHLMYLFGNGALGKSAPLPEGADFEQIFELAFSQGGWQTVFLAVKQSENPELVPSDLFKDLNTRFLISCIKNQERLEFINSVIETLEESGVETCVLKGQSLAGLYAEPDCRISGDVDLLVSLKDEQKAIEILRSLDYEVEIRPDSSNHSKCVHPVHGVLELHISLYYDIMSDVWFDNIKMLTEDFAILNGVKTLGITDNYIYVVLHAVKHFLSNGLGLRQIMDLLLFTKAYKDKIDKARVDKVFSHLKYQKFIDNLTGIGIKYLGFEKEDLFDCTYNEEEMSEILKDVEMGGLFGKNDKERKSFFEIYNQARFNTFKSENFESYMTSWRRKNALKKSSLSLKNMKKHYDFLNDKPYLLPIAYFKHGCAILKTLKKRKKLLSDVVSYKAPDTQNEKIQQRMELIKKLDMI